jgi:hypothetical protein
MILINNKLEKLVSLEYKRNKINKIIVKKIWFCIIF